MPRRRRREKHRPAAEIAAMFVGGDGVYPLWDGDPLFDSPFVARAAWQAARTAAWQHPLRGMEPPVAAVAYDDVTAKLMASNPVTYGSRWTSAAVRAWYELDVAHLETFRIQHPREAREIVDQLDAFRADLRALFAIAEGVGFDPWEARDPWGQYAMRRAPGSA